MFHVIELIFRSNYRLMAFFADKVFGTCR